MSSESRVDLQVQIPRPHGQGYLNTRVTDGNRFGSQFLTQGRLQPNPPGRQLYEVIHYQTANEVTRRGSTPNLFLPGVLNGLVDDVMDASGLRLGDYIQLRIAVKVDLRDDFTDDEGRLLRRLPRDSDPRRLIFTRNESTAYLLIDNQQGLNARDYLKRELIGVVNRMAERYSNGVFIRESRIEFRYMHRPTNRMERSPRAITATGLKRIRMQGQSSIDVGSVENSLCKKNNTLWGWLKNAQGILIDEKEDNDCLPRAIVCLMANYIKFAKNKSNIARGNVPEFIVDYWILSMNEVSQEVPHKKNTGQFEKFCFGDNNKKKTTCPGVWYWVKVFRKWMGLPDGEVPLQCLFDIARKLRSYIRVRTINENLKTKYIYHPQGITLEKQIIVDEDEDGNSFEREIFMDQEGEEEIEADMVTVVEHWERESEKYGMFTLLLDGRHIHGILRENMFLGKDYYCTDCDVAYELNGHIKCKNRCDRCYTIDCDWQRILDEKDERANFRQCIDCKRGFFTDNCFELHLVKKNGKRGVCNQRKWCGEKGCKPYLVGGRNDPDTEGGHVCGMRVCKNCKVSAMMDTHKCYMQRVAPQCYGDEAQGRRRKHSGIIYFDFECEQSTDVHRITHAVAKMIVPAKDGEGEDDVSDYVEFTPFHSKYEDHLSFHNNDVLGVEERFCHWLLLTPEHKGFTCVAHNGSGYDFMFIQRFALQNDFKPTILRMGTRILRMSIFGIDFIDSFRFITAPLSAFPKTFGLEDAGEKGYFPHFFNTPANQSYVGIMPKIDFYEPDMMRKRTSDDFRQWYQEQVSNNVVFHLQKDIMKYCRQDVDLLMKGCEKFRKMFNEAAGVDPFKYTTIAAACLACYRAYHMPENEIAVLQPEHMEFIRKGFYGGRTNVMRAFVDERMIKEEYGEEATMEYFDVKSLYPSVNAFSKYPSGHPVNYPVPDKDSTPEEFAAYLEPLFGFAEVDIDCPEDLLVPVLPSRESKKLLFNLRQKRHAVWSIIELNTAIRKGYKVRAIHRLLIWEETTTDLFRSYVDKFLKVKEEASGWGDKRLEDGSPVVTEEDKDEWIEWFHEKSDVLVEKDKVVKNPTLRMVAKLCLNSLWGKMAQKSNQYKTEYVNNMSELFDFLDKYHVDEVNWIHNSNFYEVVYRDTGDNEILSVNTNVAIACFTTAHARLKLYEGLDTVQERAMYCDTDSIIFIKVPGLPNIDTGDMLGEWGSELDHDDHIVEFVGVGPKCYGYKTKKGKTAVRSKGLRLNVLSEEQVINFANYKSAIFHEIKNAKLVEKGVAVDEGEEKPYNNFVVERTRLVRTKRDKEIITLHDFQKTFRPTIQQKGVLDTETFQLFPFGYKGVEENQDSLYLTGREEDQGDGLGTIVESIEEEMMRDSTTGYDPTNLELLVDMMD